MIASKSRGNVNERQYNLVGSADLSSSTTVLVKKSKGGSVYGGMDEIEDGESLPGDERDGEVVVGSVDRRKLAAVGMAVSFILFAIGILGTLSYEYLEGNAWSSIAVPFSTVSPASIGFRSIDRPQSSSPGPIFKNFINRQIPLPTNSWCENFFLGNSNTGHDNKVFQVPYILDTAGPTQGIRTHSTHVQANDRAVMMTYELENGLTLGAVEPFSLQHEIMGDTSNAIARLAIVLEWKSEAFKRTGTGARMSSPIVRGAPYTSMQYNSATPRVLAQRFISKDPLVDQTTTLTCGEGVGNFGPPVHVNREIQLQFDTSDHTWLIFLSEPMDFVCSNTLPQASESELPPGVVPPPDPTHEAHFELKALKPVRQGMVRIAMANNCTVGQNPIYCEKHQPRSQDAYMTLLRDHADVYPTGE